ncbi:MAG: phosphomannomutase/phosphoglucomutase [Clostridia bacterium]|nr:phosphomannomutase/phosphoglucomutase [Clostridia bacterium]
MDDIMYLKSGTDIRGTAFSTNGKPIDLTAERLQAITYAFGTLLQQKISKFEDVKVAIGYDPRISSRSIKMIVANVLSAMGFEVYDCGLSSTPSMFMSIINHNMDAAIEITASHLPMEMNGLKFFTAEGGYSGEDVKAILSRASVKQWNGSKCAGNINKLNNMETYCEGLRNMIKKGVNADDYEKPLKGLKIVVDPSNGVGEFYITEVLEPLGADTSGSVAVSPDGRFPTHQPNPENVAAMNSISEATVAADADLGIIFDTDCDRSACVGKGGVPINRNRLVALASYIALSDTPGGIIVTDSVTSDGLTEFIEKNLGGIHRRFKRGYKNVIDEAKRLTFDEGNVAPLAIETSGHAAFKDNYFLDDGAYLATRIVILAAALQKEGKTIDDLLRPMKMPAEEKELRIKINRDDFIAYGNSVIDAFRDFADSTDGLSCAIMNFEGVKVNFDKNNGAGWILLRLSLHEPLLVANCESNNHGGTEIMLELFSSFLKDYEDLVLPF